MPQHLAVTAFTTLILGGLVLPEALVACSHDTDLHAGADAAPDRSPVTDAGQGITVRSVAPRLTAAAAAPASATWAAYQLDDGPWLSLAAAGEGSYAFALPAARWAVALVCASEGDALTTVFVRHHAPPPRTISRSRSRSNARRPPPPASR